MQYSVTVNNARLDSVETAIGTAPTLNPENADSLASSALVQSPGVSATVTLNEDPDTLAAQATADTVATVEAVVTLTEAPDALSADAAIGDELSDSWTAWGDSWGDAWGFSWGVFNEPYPSLSPGVRLFVLAELHMVFVQSEVEQIIAVAELNSLSVLDAASAHFLAITQGTGTGVDRIIFASQMTVSLEDDQVSVIQRRCEREVDWTPPETTATPSDQPNCITAHTTEPCVVVCLKPTVVRLVMDEIPAA